MTYQGALPPGQGYPGQGDLYSGGGGGAASQQAGYAYQQPQYHHGQHHQMQQQQPQPPQHQFAQQNGSHHNANSLYANSMGQTQYYQPQQGQYGHPQHQPQQNHHQFQQQQHYQQQRQHPQQQHGAQMQQFGAGTGASMGGGVYHGSFQQSFPQHLQQQQQQQQQQPDVRQFAQSNDVWRQSQSPSIQHAMTPSQMQATVMQQQRSQQQHLQQLQQMQHTQQQSPQLYNASIASPQMHNQSRPSPRPRQPSIPAQHIQEYQRRISQSPIPQPSPQPRQMTPRPVLPTPQTHHAVHPAHGQTQMQPQQYHQPQPQQTYHQRLQSPHTQSPQMVQSPQLQQSPHITSQPQMQTRRQSLTPQTPTTPQPQVQPQLPQQTQSQHPLHVQPQQMFIPLEPEPEPEPEPEADPEPEPEPEPEPLPNSDEPNNIETMASVTQDSTQDELQIEQELQNEHFHFVNLQDIQNIPPPPPMPAMEFQSIDPRDLTLSFPKPLLDPLPLKHEPELEEKDTAMPNAPSPKAEPKAEPKQEPIQEPISSLEEEPRQEPKPEPKQEARPDPLKPKPRKETKVEPPKPWLKSSPKPPPPKSPSVARSPSITKRSPAPQYKQRPINTGPIMAAVAEECIGKARAQAHDVAMFLDPDDVTEYQRLISTGLSCFEGMLQSARLAPREEARTRLRYATVLHEETENIMEAETALTKGIALCDKHRMMDLKYCMQYSMLKLLFQRNHKAALKAVDGHISNCEAFKHVPWYYAFRLLKATFYMEMGNASDTSALENIRAIQNVASTRGDNALSIFASVLEGLALLKTAKEGSIEKVQSCIAQAAKFQFDPTICITQLDTLVLLLDFAASLHHQNPDATSAKLRDLQKKIDDCEDWNNVKADFMVPIKKQAASSNIVGQDTASIIDPGDGSSESDNLVITFMTKIELRSLIFMFSGLSSLHKQSSKSTDFWREGSKILETWDEFTLGIPYGPPVSLHTAIKQRQWRTEGQAYIAVMLGLLEASHCQWITVKKHMDRLEGLLSDESQPTLKLLALYLSGVYHQGLGELQTALEIFQGDRFTEPLCKSHGLKVGEQEVAMLAGLNRLWIMQHDSCRNDSDTVDLIEQLQPLCSGHWNVDLCTAWHNVMAALVTDPPQQLNQQKQHIQAAMGGSKGTGNIVGAAVTLCIMRSRFFENVIGDQALKSARAAAKQAQRSGNVLWQSVADGMLAHSYDVQGQREESRLEWEKATREARDAFKRS